MCRRRAGNWPRRPSADGSVVAPCVAVLVNPEAGLSTGQDQTAALAAIVGDRGFVRRVSAVDELAAFASEARDAGVDIVAVRGGDGTLGRAATAVATAYADVSLPILAPLGGGTMNTIARSLGLRRSRPEIGIGRIVGGDLSAQSTVRQGTMRLAGGRLGFMVGAGVPARFLALYGQGRVLGTGRAVRVLARLIASSVLGGGAAREMFAAVAARAELDGRDVGLDRISLVYCATIDQIGLGFRPTPRAREQVGRFQVLLGSVGELDLARALPRIWRGRGVLGRGWMDACGAGLHIAFHEPTLYMVDGDVGEPIGELDLRAGPVFEMLVAGA